MPYLRLFGVVTIEEDGEPFAGRAAQKRRLALLAVLAASPGRMASRDRLVGLLWPERDDEQARHLLSVAVHEIRKELGDEVLVSRGDDLVLDPVAIGSDVDDFDGAIAEGRHDAAIAIYRGPFMDGFHLGTSAPFDHWLDEQRAQHARAFRQALETTAQAREAAGDLDGAVELWRRAAVEDRYDSRVALRLVRALDAVGNRAGALQFARVHETLLREEFGTDPDPAFLAVVEEVKAGTGSSGTVPGAPAAHASTPAPSAPSRVAADPGRQAGTPSVAGGAAAPAAAPMPWPSSVGPVPVSAGREGGTPAVLRPALIVILIVGAAGVGGYLATQQAKAPAPAGLAVGVLPFASPNAADEAFADGLTEEIMDALGKVEGLRVPVRSASFALRGADAREAARRLGVDHVIDGSVRRDGDRLRIRIQLSGADGFASWSETYDRPTGAVFDTWDEIALAVLGALEVELTGPGLAPGRGGTESLAAFDLYLRGRHAWFKRTPEGLIQAIAYFRDAIAQDPRYARAYTGLSDAYSLMAAYEYGLLPPDSAYPIARRAAERALALAPDLAEANAALANVLFAYDRDWAGAERAYGQAIELNPRFAEARHWYSLFLVAGGREEESMAEARRALALDSLSPIMRTSMSRHLYFRGEYARALDHSRAALEIDPSFVIGHHGVGLVLLELGRPHDAVNSFRRALDLLGRPHPASLALLGHALGRAGRIAEARDVLRRLEQAADGGAYVAPEYLAIVHIGLGDAERAIDQLAAAAAARSGAVAFFAADPLTRPLHGHPRFQRLLELGPRARTGPAGG